MQEKLQKRKCVTLLSENTDPSISDRIIISYYTSTLRPSYKHVQRLYFRHGDLVVSIVNSPKVNVLRMLRVTLIALCLYPKFLRYLPHVGSAYILKNWVKVFCKVNEKKYTRLPLRSLFKEASCSMELIRNSVCGGRVTVISTPNVKDSLINLHVIFLTLTESMLRRKNCSLTVRQLRSSRVR